MSDSPIGSFVGQNKPLKPSFRTSLQPLELEAIKGKENAPIFTTTHEKYPGLLDRQIVDPKNMLVSSALDPVIANDAAQRNFSDKLGAASIIPHLNREVEA